MEKKEIYKKEFKTYDTTFYSDHLSIESYQNYHNPQFKKGTFEFTGERVETEESFNNNLSNLLCTVVQQSSMIVLEECGDKLSFKVFKSSYSRNVGIKFFSKKKYCFFLTVNKKTGDFYVGNILNYQNKKKFTKQIRKNPTNYIGMIVEQIGIILSPFKYDLSGELDKNNLLEIYARELGIVDFTETVHSSSANKFAKNLIRYSLLKKNVGLPDNFESFFDYQYFDHIPKLKLLKKNNLKFIDAFMSHHGIKGNEIKKNLHICNFSNVKVLKLAINYFGYDKIYRSNIILDLLNHQSEIFYFNYQNELTQNEKERLFHYYLLHLKGNISSHTLTDHIQYYQSLKTYGERVTLSCKTIDDFVTEHANWSVLIASYTTGHHVRNYPSVFQDKVQQTIFDFNSLEYHPVLLRSTEEYNEESAYQNNCVRTYIEKCSSIIVSFRNLLGEERATVEYNIKYDPQSKKLNLNRVQSQGKFNRALSESWNHVLEILDQQVNNALSSCKFEMSIKTTYVNNKTHQRKMCINEPSEIHGHPYVGLIQWSENNSKQYLDF